MCLHSVEQTLGEGCDAARKTLSDTLARGYQLVARLLMAVGREELALAVCGIGKRRSRMLDARAPPEGDALAAERDMRSVDVLESLEGEWASVSDMVRTEGCHVMEYSFLDDEQLAVWVVSGEGSLARAATIATGEERGWDLSELLKVVEAAFAEAGGGGSRARNEDDATQPALPAAWRELLVGEDDAAAVVMLMMVDGARTWWERLGQARQSAASWRELLRWGLRGNAPDGLDGPDEDLRARVRGIPDAALKELHRRLVSPVADALSDATEVLVIPHEALCRV
eukprot:1183847-Rhodomonas_salina.1